MIFLNYNLRKIFIVLAGIFLLNFLNSCGIWDPADARKGTNYQFASSNPMWRATLEILDFLPLANVDYSGGIITTDWYNEGTASDEAIKITIRFLTNEIRADGLKVIVHKKKCNIKQKCTVKKISSALEYELQVAILKKAAIFEKEYTSKNRKKRPRIK